jgi:hypothetical protein
METANEVLTWLANFSQRYPDLLAIFIGTVCAWAVGILVETYLIPLTWPVRQQKGFTVLATIITAAVMSSLVWGVLDSADSLRMRIVICIALAPLSPFSYVIVGRILTKRFPGIGSVWALGPEPKP